MLIVLFSQISLHADPIPPSVIEQIEHATQLASQGRRGEALEEVDQALKVLEQGDHVGEAGLGDSLCIAAKIRRECGDPTGGLAVAKAALKVAQERKADNNHALGLAYFAIAMCEASLRHTEESEDAAKAGWIALGKVPYKDPTVPNLIPRCSVLTNLAGVYQEMEDYLMAEKYYRLSARDGDMLMGFAPQDVSYDLGKYNVAGRTFSSIGGFYVSVGDNRRAIPYLTKSLETRSKADPSGERLGLEDTYMNLSRAYLALGESQKAEDYSRKGIMAASQGMLETRNVTAKGTMGGVLASKGDYVGALEIMEEMAAQFREIRKDPSFEHPSVVNNVGFMQLRLERYDEARKTLTKALTLAASGGMGGNELVGNILFSLAELEFLTGDVKRGVLDLRKTSEVYEQELERLVGFGSESQKLAYLQRLRGKTDFVIGAHFGLFPDDQELAREALLMLFQRKDRMTQLTRESVARSRLLGTEDKAQDNIAEIRSRLGLLNLSLGVLDRGEALDLGQDWMVDLENEMRASSEAARNRPASNEKALKFSDVAEALGDKEVLIEYVVYQPYTPQVPKDKKKDLPLRCGAFILNSKGEVGSRDLGEVEGIQQAAISFRRSLAQPGNEDYIVLGKILYGTLVAPLEPLIGDATSWKLAPDGQLNLVPFEAFIGEGGKFLTERATITYLATGAELIQPARSELAAEGMTIIAGPSYEMQNTRPAARSASEKVPDRLATIWEDISTNGAPLQFSPLPGTVNEAGMIRKMIPDARLVTGAEARESVVRGLKAARVIHIATHGFYLNEDTIGAKEQRGLKRVKPAPIPELRQESGLDEEGWIGQRSLDHPLLNCGLAFAGANHLHDGEDDGILTGMEVLGLDLSGTDLVVLSACETGVGKVLTGEGVLGLRQAFRVAGASSTVMSLWKVNDEATAELMVQFYQGLADGKPKSEALRLAANKLRSQEKWKHPAYWSAFLFSGDDGLLSIKGLQSK